MKRKLTAILLASALAGALLAGCGGTGNSAPTQSPENAAEAVSAAMAAAEAVSAAGAAADSVSAAAAAAEDVSSAAGAASAVSVTVPLPASDTAEPALSAAGLLCVPALLPPPQPARSTPVSMEASSIAVSFLFMTFLLLYIYMLSVPFLFPALYKLRSSRAAAAGPVSLTGTLRYSCQKTDKKRLESAAFYPCFFISTC